MTSDENRFNVSRRSLLAGAATFPFFYNLTRTLSVYGDSKNPGLVIREKEPQNLESDFASLDSVVTPNNRFYIRNHFAAPAFDANSWSLKIEGAVKNPLRFSYEEFLRLPSETKTVTLECAGNGRVYLVPKVEGVQWQLGAVGTAEWTGVPLNSLFERTGIEPSAADIVLEGADAGEPTKPSKPGQPITFARSIPVDEARNGGILLAYKMNGEPLPQAHGFPVRAIVPGWYGMASVKWLARIVAVKQPYHGYFQTVDYAYWKHREGFPVRVPVTEMQVKSQIARPTVAEVIEKGTTYRIFGAAWSGNSPIVKVEVSTDGGKTYAAARLLGKPVEQTWRLWEFPWQVPAKRGTHTVMTRATDAKGNSQPLTRDKDREAYLINQVLPVEVQIQ
jgi:DMSO/TMAO reductase YedYZ molybdopterin-dependent catalytic subunit